MCEVVFKFNTWEGVALAKNSYILADFIEGGLVIYHSQRTGLSSHHTAMRMLNQKVNCSVSELLGAASGQAKLLSPLYGLLGKGPLQSLDFFLGQEARVSPLQSTQQNRSE